MGELFWKIKSISRPTITPNQSKTPSVIYSWQTYTISERKYISEYLIRSWLGKSPWKNPKNCQNMRGYKSLNPLNPPFLPKIQRIIFYHKLDSILSRKLVLYVKTDPRGPKDWHIENGQKLVTAREYQIQIHT